MTPPCSLGRSLLASLLCALLVTPAFAKRRAVIPPPAPPAPTFLVPAIVPTTLSLTNFDSTPAVVQVCEDTCTTDTIASGAMHTYQRPAGLLRISSSTTSLEARTRELDPAPLLTSEAALPIYDMTAFTQVLRTFASASTTVDVQVRGDNGVWQSETTIAVPAGIMDTPLSAFPGAAGRKQLELVPHGPVGAFLLRTDAAGKTLYVPAQAISTATGISYFLHVGASTVVTEKNPDPAHLLGVNNEYYPAETEVRAPVDPAGQSLINYGIITLPALTTSGTGALVVTGAPQTDGPNAPVITWALDSGTILPVTPEQAAVATSNIGNNAPSDKIPMYNDEISNVQADDTIGVLQALEGNTPFTAIFATVTGTINGYDQTGTKTGSYAFTLRGKENLYRRAADILPGASRIELTIDTAPSGYYLTPMAVMTTMTPTGFMHTPHRTLRAAPKTTGAQVVATLLQPLHDAGQGFYLDYSLMRCAHTGDCGVAPIREQLATIYARNDTSAAPWSAPQFSDYLAMIANGVTTPADPEMWMQEKPFTWSATGGVAYTITTSQEVLTIVPGTITMPPADRETTWQTLSTFIAAYYDQHPERGCGSTTAGPSLQATCYGFTSRSNGPYAVTTTIKVVDHGQTFQQVTHPSIATVDKLVNVNNPDAMIGSHGYDCTDSPDPVVNSIPELLANYAKLTPAEQQDFTGDAAGFAPFAANGCNANTTQYVLFISIVVAKGAPVTGEAYMTKWFDPYTSTGVFLNLDETTCLLNEACGVTGYRAQLFHALYPSSGFSGTEAQLIAHYQQLTDGDQANGELYTAQKPGRVNFTPGQMAVCFAIAPQGNLSCLTYSDTEKPAVLSAIRGYEVARADTLPQLYGGSPATGPDINHDPQFWNIAATTSTVTGEQYVTKWLDPLKTQYFYLSNAEVHDLLNGTPEVSSYAPQLAAVLGPATGNSPMSMESILRSWVDGNAANGEVYAGFDPMNVDMRSPGGIRFYMAPDGTGASDFKVDATTMHLTYGVIRDFLVQHTQAYPASYGGSASTGPSLGYNPTWSTQDSNASPAQYVLQTVVGVWQNGQALRAIGTTTNPRLMQVITGSTNLDPFLGNNSYSNTNPNYADLQAMITRITANFTADDYLAAFGETKDTMLPFFTDTDGDGYAIDVGPTDVSFDDRTSAPANQPTGTQYINYSLTKH